MPFQEKKSEQQSHECIDFVISILLRPFTFGFSLSAAKKVKERDHFRCVDCRSSRRLVASHKNHNHTNRDEYDNPDNGETRCVYCEVVHHLKYWNNPESIGLTFDRNVRGLVKQWALLKTREQNELANRFPKSVYRIRQQCSNR